MLAIPGMPNSRRAPSPDPTLRPMGLPSGLNPAAANATAPIGAASAPSSPTGQMSAAPNLPMPPAMPKDPASMSNPAVGGPPLPQLPSLPGVSVTGTNPNADLRNTTIAPTNDVNRYDLVNQHLQNYDKTALPQFQANVRGLVQKNAALGKLGSGMLNTDLGNETLAAENARNSYFGNLLTDATQGTIADAANNRNELRTERGYQTGAEQSAYDRARQGVFDTDALKNSQFGRDYATTQLGYEGNPASLLAQLSGIIGNQGAQTAAGAGSSIAGNSTLDILRQILAESQASPTVAQNVPNYPIPPVRG